MSRFTKLNKYRKNKKNVTPIGLKNGVNLVYTLPDSDEFISGTLEVFLSGLKMCGDQLDPDRDYDEDVGLTSFTFRIDPNLRHRLNAPPCTNEYLTINYFRKRKCN